MKKYTWLRAWLREVEGEFPFKRFTKFSPYLVASYNEYKGEGGGDSRTVSVDVCRRSPQNLTLFKTKFADFATLFKTRDLIPFVLHIELGNFSN